MAETETPVKEPTAEGKAAAAETGQEAPAAETRVKEAPGVETPEKETKTEEAPGKPGGKKSGKKAVVLLLLLLAVGIAAAVHFLFFKENDDGRIPYAEGVVLVEGSEVEPADEGWINLRYNKKAFSTDGIHFAGLLANDPGNARDMYFDVYADENFEDQIFLSGLLKPGFGLQTIELLHELPAGSTTCYVIHNQVDADENGNQVIIRQMITTVEFVVN
ncbi:MAG: hypothetical protein J1F18_07085 [Lachnospiraceae bacterium]|nr:hypothetical protein [Lachnospiraceae bacterium]